jgi:hypothetical protein
MLDFPHYVVLDIYAAQAEQFEAGCSHQSNVLLFQGMLDGWVPSINQNYSGFVLSPSVGSP